MTLLPPSLFQHPLWEEEKNPIWLGSSLTLSRNLTQFKFPPKQNERELASCATTLAEALQAKSTLYFPAEKLSPLDKEFLFEHFLCLEGFQNASTGQGALIDETGRFLALINLKNHLHLQLIDVTGDISGTWSQLSKLEMEIGKKLEYAFSPKFGYLTSDPLQCGTALQAVIYLHVPALHHTGELHGLLKDDEVIATSLEGSVNDLIGDFLILKNRYTLGVSEEGILHSLQTAAMKLMAAEKAVRSHLKQKGNPDIKDLVSRAYGLLLHSYQLQTKEALNALSAIKLGLDLGWITGITSQVINNLFFKCRHAHLAFIHNATTLDTQDLPHQRAAFIHKEIAGITLLE
jgi:protein arginine kinase